MSWSSLFQTEIAVDVVFVVVFAVLKTVLFCRAYKNTTMAPP